VLRYFVRFGNGYSQQASYAQNGFPGAQNGFPGPQNGFGSSQAYSHGQNGYQGGYNQNNRGYGSAGQRNGYQGQRFNNRFNGQNGGGNQGMFNMPPPFLVQPGSDGVQSLINNKFFQTNRPPPSSNACAYQSISPSAFGGFQPPMTHYYSYTQPQAVQQ